MKSQQAKEIGLLGVLVLLMITAVIPLLRDDPPCTHDGGLHYFRIVAMRYALQDGLLGSRWVPDLAFGYGYPFFNYRAAFSYYLGLALHLIGLPLPLALNLVYVLAMLASAIGVYLLGRDLFGRWAGLVAAVAYVYAPYTFIDALVRGNMPESVALALFPFILWAFRRLLLGGQARYLLSSVGSLALLYLTHNISSLLFTPFLVAYLLALWWARGRRGHLVTAGVALMLSLGLTAFFWAPAVLEKDYVQLHLSRMTRNNDFHYNFVNLSEVFAPPEPVDSALLNPPLQLPVGLPLALLALLGSIGGLWCWRPRKDTFQPDAASRERWVTVVFLVLSAVIMVFMATRASLPLWENLPLVAFVQFPWRFVGRAVLPLSLLAGAFVTALLSLGWGGHKLPLSLLLVLSVTLLIVTALPFTYPPTGYCPTKPQPNILDLFAYEHLSRLVGVDPEGSYFPVTVQARPIDSPLEAQYAAALDSASDDGEITIARFDTESLPDGTTIHWARYAPNYAKLEIETPQATRARYLTFAFAGWQVRVDGRPVEIIPSTPEGLITFDLSAGRHTVEIDWGSTPIRAGATMLSILALASVAFVTYISVRDYFADRIQATSPNRSQTTHRFITQLNWAHIATLALLALMLLAFKVFVVDRTDTPLRHSGLQADSTLADVDVPLDVRFKDGVRLLGYDRSTAHMPSDGTLHLAFYWSAYVRPTRSYKATVVLQGPDGQLWSDKSAFPRRGYADLPPSSAWGNGRYAVQGLDIEPLSGTPPGRYNLLLTAFDRETLAPLDVFDESGQIAGPNLVVGQVTLTRPSYALDPDAVTMQYDLDVDMGPLTLLGANLDRAQAAPGDPMLVTLFWHKLDTNRIPDLQARLTLQDQQDHTVHARDLLVHSDWSTSQWQAGDLWRGQHALRLPASLASGTYTWGLELFDPVTQQTFTPQATLGQLQVQAPARRWQPPDLQLPLDATLTCSHVVSGDEPFPEGKKDDCVTLLGANLQPTVTTPLQAPVTLTVTLAWQGQVEMHTSYRVFLHLLKPDGSLLTQSDGEPADWTRPTTGWAPGEVILDTRVLDIPAEGTPGSYALIAGLYDPDTQQRLVLDDGSTRVILITRITLQP
jgi:hypothetical protein